MLTNEYTDCQNLTLPNAAGSINMTTNKTSMYTEGGQSIAYSTEE